MRCSVFIAIVISIAATSRAGESKPPATTQPARWIVEARIVETASAQPTTQPAAATQPTASVLVGNFEWPEDAEAFFRPDVKPLASIQVLAAANESFSANAIVAGTSVHLAGRARRPEQGDRVMMQLEFEQRGVSFGTATRVKTNIALTIGKPIVIGGLVGVDRPPKIAVRLTPQPQQEK